MKSSADIQELHDLYDQMLFAPGGKHASLFVSNEAILNKLRYALSNHELSGFEAFGETPQIHQNFELDLEGQNLNQYGYFFYTFEDFLHQKNNLIEVPRYYYIADLKWSSLSENEQPDEIKSYYKLLDFIGYIKEVAQYTDSGKKHWYLTYEDKSVQISMNLDLNTFKNLDYAEIEKFSQFFSDNIHRKQKLSIFNKVLVNRVTQIEEFQDTFNVLLLEIDEIFQKIEEDFSVFASNFSYEKIVNQLENEKLEEQVKIHKILTDIQSQILGIPIATVIVATQYRVDLTQESTLWINLAILVGVLIFTLLMTFTAHNQKNTLEAISVEINRKKNILQKQFKRLADEKPYENLEKRIKYQNIVLTVIQYIVWGGLVIASIFFLKIHSIY